MSAPQAYASHDAPWVSPRSSRTAYRPFYRWIIPAWFALFPFQLYSTIPGTHITLRVAYVAGGVLLFRSLLRSSLGQRDLVGTALDLPFLVFGIVLTVSAALGDDIYLGFKGVYDWLATILTFVVCAGILQSEPQIWRAVRGLEAGILAQGLIGFSQYVLGDSFSEALIKSPVGPILYQPNVLKDKMLLGNMNWLYADRVLAFGTALNNIVFAVLMAIGISLSGGIVFAGCGRRFDFVLLLTCTLALLMSLKLTGFVAALIGIGSLVGIGLVVAGRWEMIGTRRRRRRRILLLVVILAGCLASFLCSNRELAEIRLLDVAEREFYRFGDDSRWMIWADYLESVKDHPLLGLGPYNTPPTAPRVLSMQRYKTIDYAAPESSYVAAIVETGFLGFAALLWVLWRSAVLGVRAVRQAPSGSLYGLSLGAFSGLISAAAGGLTVTCLNSDQISMAIGGLLAVLVATLRFSDGPRPWRASNSRPLRP